MKSQQLTAFLLLILIILPLSEPQKTSNQTLLGNYRKINFTDESELHKLDMFTQSDKLCKKEYYERWGTTLEEIIQVYSQIVAGINYKIVYKTNCVQSIYFVVFTQSWTNTVKITEVRNNEKYDSRNDFLFNICSRIKITPLKVSLKAFFFKKKNIMISEQQKLMNRLLIFQLLWLLILAHNLQFQEQFFRVCPKNSPNFTKIKFSQIEELYLYPNFKQIQKVVTTDYELSNAGSLLQIYQVYVKCFFVIYYQLIFSTTVGRYYYLVHTDVQTKQVVIIDRGVWNLHVPHWYLDDYYPFNQ